MNRGALCGWLLLFDAGQCAHNAENLIGVRLEAHEAIIAFVGLRCQRRQSHGRGAVFSEAGRKIRYLRAGGAERTISLIASGPSACLLPKDTRRNA